MNNVYRWPLERPPCFPRPTDPTSSAKSYCWRRKAILECWRRMLPILVPSSLKRKCTLGRNNLLPNSPLRRPLAAPPHHTPHAPTNGQLTPGTRRLGHFPPQLCLDKSCEAQLNELISYLGSPVPATPMRSTIVFFPLSSPPPTQLSSSISGTHIWRTSSLNWPLVPVRTTQTDPILSGP